MNALGCNGAFGIIDAFFYLLNSRSEGHGIALLKQLRRTWEPGEAKRKVANALHGIPPLEPQEIESLKGRVIQIPQSTGWPRLAKDCSSRPRPLANAPIPRRRSFFYFLECSHLLCIESPYNSRSGAASNLRDQFSASEASVDLRSGRTGTWVFRIFQVKPKDFR